MIGFGCCEHGNVNKDKKLVDDRCGCVPADYWMKMKERKSTKVLERADSGEIRNFTNESDC